MDFSVKNIKANKNLAFKGLKGGLDLKNNQIFRFVAPPHKKDETVTLEIAPLDFDESLGEYMKPSEDDFVASLSDISDEERSLQFDSSDVIDISQQFLKDCVDAFAYRYKITDKDGNFVRYATDKSKTIRLQNGGENANFIAIGANYGVTPKAGNMYHVYKDSYGIVDEANKTLKNPQGSDFVRNHFNKLGGSTKGILYILKNTDELKPYRYVMSTPDIGADKVSSHGYWPNNLYQCADIEAFEDLNTELFKQGKGYIADGAFTSQGLQSPLVQHVLKWGEKSPFYNMLKIDGRLNLGVLPDEAIESPDNIKKAGIRIVNNPYSKDYDRKQPTYLQFFDYRLASDEQLKDGKKIIETYEGKPQDHYEIAFNEDATYPYYFEIDPKDTRLALFKNANYDSYENIIAQNPDFLDFENFSITDRSHASGATFWAGNRDLVKLNLSNPNGWNQDNIKGMQNARNYLYGVATFWTEDIQSKLILETAKMSERELSFVAKANGVDEETLEEIKTNPSLGEHPVLENKKSVEDYIKTFPLQSMETNSDLSAVFSEPGFNEKLFDQRTMTKMAAVVNKALSEATPAEYRDNPEYRQYMVKAYANKIIKNVLADAMGVTIMDEGGNYLNGVLKDVSLKALLKAKPFSVENERNQVVSKIQNGINSKSVNNIVNRMKADLKDVSLDDFKTAELFVAQAKGGLNWRFDAAKDIGDMDAVSKFKGYGTRSFTDIWDGKNGVEAFWTNFIGRIKENNPSAYIISEITDFWSFNKENDYETFDPKITKANRALYPNHVPDDRMPPRLKEARFLENTGSTTSSNYDACFNKLSTFIGVEPEHGGNKQKDSGNISSLKFEIDKYLNSNQPNIALLSHTFVDNHDKPRFAHCLPLDMDTYLGKNIDKSEYQKLAKELTGGRTDYLDIVPQAVAVGDIFNKQIDKLDKNEAYKNALKHALRNLINGKKDDLAAPSYKRALTFGVLPYEVTIRDMFKNAGVTYNQQDLDEFHHGLMENSIGGLIALNEVMNAITGTPTTFGGTEFLQTGYETPSHNEYVGNRGIIRHDLKNNPLYAPLYNKFSAISSMYQKPELAAIRDGFPVSLNIVSSVRKRNNNFKGFPDTGKIEYQYNLIKDHGGLKALDEYFKKADLNPKTMNETFGIYQGEEDFAFFKKYYETPAQDEFGNYFYKPDGSKMNIFEAQQDYLEYLAQEAKKPSKKEEDIEVWPIFKYDENGSKVVQLISGNGLKGKISKDNDFKTKSYVADSIAIANDDGCPLDDGTILKRLVYDENKKDYVDSEEEYIINNGAIERKDGAEFHLNDTVETFYVPSKSKMNAQIKAQYHGHNY